MNGDHALEARVRTLEQTVAKQEAYWEAQTAANRKVEKSLASVEMNQGQIQTDIQQTRSSLRGLTNTLRWVLGIFTAVCAGVLVTVIVRLF